MVWEIVLAIILMIGIYTAIREAGERRSAHRKEAGRTAPEQHSSDKFFRENNK